MFKKSKKSGRRCVGQKPGELPGLLGAENQESFAFREGRFKKTIALLGSTGSVGRNVLDVVRKFPSQFKIAALAAGKNRSLLEKQILEFKPRLAALFDKKEAALLKKTAACPVLSGKGGLSEVARMPSSDILVASSSGLQGLEPVLQAIDAGKDIALANKEVLVSAGAMVMSRAAKKKVRILPVDSEHSAVFQCLRKENKTALKKIILTASGGPFWKKSLKEIKKSNLEDALKHPTWQMGPKITIDSATLMNKGLEVIEASHLFGLPAEQIQVVIHPESLVHSLVEFSDHSILAQFGYPDMQLPILYALCYPQRSAVASIKSFDFTKHFALRFFPPDFNKFRCLGLAYEALIKGKSVPGYLNAANEILVNRFLNGRISFSQIPEKLEKLIASHFPEDVLNLKTVLQVDAEARKYAKEI